MSKDKTYKIKFSTGSQTNVDVSDLEDLKIISEKDNRMVVQVNQKIYKLDIVDFNPKEKTFEIKINDRMISLKLNNQLDLLLEEMGLDQIADDNISNLEAPMPGLVLDVLVAPGDEVEKGTPLLILEAMKMENIIKSNGSAIVEKIFVTKSEKVEKSQLLIKYKD